MPGLAQGPRIIKQLDFVTMTTDKKQSTTAGPVKCYGYNAEGLPLRTQEAFMKHYLISTGEHVTTRTVADKWGFHRLSALIFKLKNQLLMEGGVYVIKDRYCTGPNRFGIRATWKEYWIEKVK